MLNILAIHAMRKSWALQKILKTLLLNLAVSDLCVGLCAQPINVVHLLVICRTEEPTALKIVVSFLSCAFWYASFLSIMALGAERFVAIHLHLRYQELVTHKRVVVLATIVWAVSALLSLITSLWPSIGKKIVAVFFGFCFICSLIFYRKIYSTVRRHTNQIQALQVHDGEMAVNVAKIKRSGLCTCYVYVLFLLCYLPYCSGLVADIFFRKPNITYDNFLRYTLGTLVFVNSSLNPVYCLVMRDVRQSILSILRNLFIRQN